MRMLAFVACLVLLPSAHAPAQTTTPLMEVSAAYSLVNGDGRQWNGWLASGSVTIVRWFGVAAEIGTNHNSERYNFGGQQYEEKRKRGFVGVGPRFVARGGAVTGFAHFLVGPEEFAGANELGMQAGGGADFWIAKRVALRAGFDGRVSWYDDPEGSWRFHAGAVLALGGR